MADINVLDVAAELWDSQLFGQLTPWTRSTLQSVCLFTMKDLEPVHLHYWYTSMMCLVQFNDVLTYVPGMSTVRNSALSNSALSVHCVQQCPKCALWQ